MTDRPLPVCLLEPSPTPRWLWAAFTLGPAFVCALAAAWRPGASAGTTLRDGAAGLVAGLLLAGGLALAERFFAGRAARMAGGLVFAGLLAVGGAAVGFAGCIPYPVFRTVQPVRATTLAPARSRGGPTPAPTPQPTPHTVVEWHLFPVN